MSSVPVSIVGVMGTFVIAFVLVEGSGVTTSYPLGVRKVIGVVLIIVIVIGEIVE